MTGPIRRRRLAMLASIAIAVGSSHVAFVSVATAQPAVFAVGQSVEVREGDQWSKATIKAKEGRRIQIAYEDGTEEWVTGDRIRASTGDAAGTDKPADSTSDTTDKPAAPEKPRQFAVNTAVEAKWGSSWWKGTIASRRGMWHLVRYDNGKTLEWVEPWRIRLPTDTAYDIDWSGSNGYVKNASENPPKPTPGAAPAVSKGRADPFAAEAVSWPVAELDRSGVNEVVVGISEWTYKPPAEPPIKIGNKSIALSQLDNQSRAGGMDVNGDTALITYTRGHGKDEIGAAEVVDIGAGRISYRGDLAPESLPRSVTPDGKRIIGQARGFFGGTKGRVDVWDVPTAGISAAATAKAKHVVSFNPFMEPGEGRETRHDVAAVYAIDAEHLVVANVNGTVMGVKVGAGTASAVWRCSVESQSLGTGAVAISGDRKTLAIAGPTGVTLLDTANGNVLGTIESQAGALAFRGDGKRLLGMKGSVLYVFDLESGRQLMSLALPGPLTRGPIVSGPNVDASTLPPASLGTATEARWISGDLIYIAGSDVVFNVKDNAVLGVYRMQGSNGMATVGERLVAAIKPSGSGRALASWDAAALTPPNSKPATPAYLTAVPSGVGTEVTFDIGGLEADEATKTAILENLTRQADTRGWKQGNGRIRVVARSESGRSEQRTYEQRGFGRPFGGEQTQVTVTEKITRMTIEIDGKPVWETRTSSMAGSMVQLQQGQSMQDAVNASSRSNAGFLQRITLPETFFEPMESLPAGTSQYDFLPGGVRMMK